MMPDDNLKPKTPAPSPAEIEKLLEIEFMQQRALSQKAKAKRGNLRALSFFFLFLVIAAALFGFFFFFSPDRIQELKSSAALHHPPSPSPAESPR